ncbi:hypothetical protein HHL25_01255 [Rhizobium sp. S-51]|uniref:SIR2-like domain-containing protein n=1 Tax=Rhizobium terricola TaxID=2728849 RepID=A0A7Y0ASM4_9HYPH|nr:hypothetical protein [Rhizobium terricola]NML72742.1 hypothetical protein [Rhizobium terricola]
MFFKKTVFVVGAGASKELGLPIGNELKDQIARKLHITFPDGFNLGTGDRDIYNAVKLYLRSKGQSDGNPYWSAGRSIASAMPQAISIDNFMHTHYDDDKIVLMGKLAIAASILEAERRSLIFADERQGNRHDFNTASGVWHNIFCKMLTEGIQRSTLPSLFENVSFISFNYDRCIEQYLAIWLENYMRLPANEAQSIVNELTIVHPYGQIGKLGWQTMGMVSVGYGENVQPTSLFEVASNIRTFTEQVEDETVPELMRRLITDAEQVIYLGFSFGAMNMELMKISEMGPPKKLYGTAHGISRANLEVITQHLARDMKVGKTPLLHSHFFEASTCGTMLNDYFRVLTD